MFNRLESVEEKYLQLEQELSKPEILANQKEYQKVTREHAEMSPVVEAYRQYRKLTQQILENQQMLEAETDPEMIELI